MAADGKKTRNKKAVKADRTRSNNAPNKNLVLGAIIVLIIIVAAAVVFSDRGTSGTSRHNTTSQPMANFNSTNYKTTVPQAYSGSNSSGNGQTKFAGSNYSYIAHLLYGPNQTSIKFKAPGFNESLVDLSSGAVNITFRKLGNVGYNVVFTVPKGYSLYYLEGSYGDDNPPAAEYSLIDDGVILVNPQGYVVGNVVKP
jgi:hypothetical protein